MPDNLDDLLLLAFDLAEFVVELNLKVDDSSDTLDIFLKNDPGQKELKESNNIPHLILFLHMDTYVS